MTARDADSMVEKSETRTCGKRSEIARERGGCVKRHGKERKLQSGDLLVRASFP